MPESVCLKVVSLSPLLSFQPEALEDCGGQPRANAEVSNRQE